MFRPYQTCLNSGFSERVTFEEACSPTYPNKEKASLCVQARLCQCCLPKLENFELDRSIASEMICASVLVIRESFVCRKGKR